MSLRILIVNGSQFYGVANYLVRAAEKGATVTIGAAYASEAAARLRERTDICAAPRFSGKVALVAHVFYVELASEIIEAFRRLPVGSALLVTTPAESLTHAKRAFAEIPGTRIVPVPNRGRDIAPFLALLNAGELYAFDAVLKLHTKRSLHLRDGGIRRRLAYAMLAGSRRRVQQVLGLFERPDTGVVGWRPSWRRRTYYWMRDRERCNTLARAMGLPNQARPAFFEGTMFWVRPAALRALAALQLAPDDFEPESGQVDGALHHAVERVFAIAAAGEGYRVCDISGRELLGSSSCSTSPR